MRRYLQFRLRSLFILTTLAAVLAWVVPPAIEQWNDDSRKRAARRKFLTTWDLPFEERVRRLPGIRMETTHISKPAPEAPACEK